MDNRVAKYLEEKLEILNIGLSFFGVRAIINSDNKNQVDFYERDEILTSKKFHELDNLKMQNKFGYNIRYNYIKHSSIEEEHQFCLSFDKDQKNLYYWFSIIKNSFISDKYTGINIKTTIKEKQEDDFVIRKLNIGFNSFSVVETIYYPDFNKQKFQNDSNEISIDFNYNEPTLCIKDCSSNLYLLINDFRLLINNDVFSYDTILYTPKDLSLEVLKHPRIKEIINSIVKEIDNQLPGVEEFIYNNFLQYKYIRNSECQKDTPFYRNIEEFFVQNFDEKKYTR